MTYQEFIEAKICLSEKSGFEIEAGEINPLLKPHQKDSVVWGIRGGCRAFFEAFGLGKTFIQLETCRLVVKHKGGKALIILPLGVKQEFYQDAEKLNIRIQYVRNDAEVQACDCDIMITNYERVRDGQINVKQFRAVSLDEASVLRTLNGAQSVKGKEQHICPLPFDIVERAIDRFTNPGDTVLDPFGGVMTVVYQAVKMGRQGYGIELNSRYWQDGTAYCKAAELEYLTPDLFSLEEIG